MKGRARSGDGIASRRRARSQPKPNEPESHRLAELVPLAVVIAGGCAPCAERMVRRAVENGTPDDLIERTLRIVADLRSRDCFVNTVGPEVVQRMDQPLAAARRVLEGRAGPPRSHECCG
jgi:hypothetical protein